MSELINAVNTFTPDNLFGGSDIPAMTKVVTLVSGAGDLARGTVLGKIIKGSATAAAKSGGNAANTGALTMDATTPVLAGAKVGVYTVRCITAATNGGTFRVTDPDGFVLGDVAVAATFANDIKFAIADGTQDFIVGEGFDITVAAGSGYYKTVNSANVDGSDVAECILAANTNATSAAVAALVYVTGQFNTEALTFGGSDDAADHRETLHLRGIILTTEQ